MPTSTGTWSTGRIRIVLSGSPIRRSSSTTDGPGATARSRPGWATWRWVGYLVRVESGSEPGAGWLELGLLEAGSVGRFDLVDVSSGALEQALQKAEELRIRDRVTTVTGDIDAYDLGEGQYDVATCMDSLHHLDELDTVVASVARALVPGGALVGLRIRRSRPFRHRSGRT